MKRQFAFVALMLATAVAIAKPVDPATARQAAERFLGRAVVNVTPKDITECYIFNAVDGHGFVLLAADDCVTPLLGYSEEDPFGVEEMPCNLSAWMDSYRRQIAEARAQGLTASSEVASEWRGLLSGVCSPKDGNEGDVDPLLTSKWNQSPRYNNRCPYDSVRQAHTLVGCVATAVSQVMRYWQHPVQPRGSHSYQWRKGSGVIGVNYDTSTYDFTLMPDELKASSSAEQIDAVAKLCFEVGASMDMAAAPTSSQAVCLSVSLQNWLWRTFSDTILPCMPLSRKVIPSTNGNHSSAARYAQGAPWYIQAVVPVAAMPSSSTVSVVPATISTGAGADKATAIFCSDIWPLA